MTHATLYKVKIKYIYHDLIIIELFIKDRVMKNSHLKY